MRKLRYLSIIIATALASCHKDPKNDDGPKNTDPITQLATMHIQAADSNVLLHFYYDADNYVTKITETDTVHGSITTDSLMYYYSINHALHAIDGYIGHPLNNYQMYFTYYPSLHSLEGLYYTGGSSTDATEATDVDYDSVSGRIIQIWQSFPTYTGWRDTYDYNTSGNIAIDTSRSYISSDSYLNKITLFTYDAKNNYGSLLKGIINPSIHNFYFPISNVNNCTSQTITDYTGPSPVTTTIYTAYEYNDQQYPVKSISTNTTTGETVTITFTYK